MNPFEEQLTQYALDPKQASDFFMKLQGYVASAESDQDLHSRFHAARAYLIGWIHGGGDLEMAKTFDAIITSTHNARSLELR